uniref:Uncharacterized protein n=1 Tax=Setaria viridis TaxID=4556 RepID=A0A4U6W4V4_SETVI|nr:hypothetical protein SEVIR_2G391500v2 [Setaria viridis]
MCLSRRHRRRCAIPQRRVVLRRRGGGRRRLGEQQDSRGRLRLRRPRSPGDVATAALSTINPIRHASGAVEPVEPWPAVSMGLPIPMGRVSIVAGVAVAGWQRRAW